MRLFLKISVVGFAIISLVASGTTSQSGLVSSIQRSSLTGDTKFQSAEATMTQNGAGEITFIIGAKTYKFTSEDLQIGENYLYYQLNGDESIQVQNSSKRNMEGAHGLVADDLALWYVNIENSSTNITDRGYIILGTRSDSVPATGNSTYNGRIEGYLTNEPAQSQHFIDGESQIIANFATQSVSGEFSNIKTYDLNGDGSGVDSTMQINIENAQISQYGFAGQLSATENAQAVNMVSSEIHGGFYGDADDQVGGVARFETDADVKLVFSFVGKK